MHFSLFQQVLLIFQHFLDKFSIWKIISIQTSITQFGMDWHLNTIRHAKLRCAEAQSASVESTLNNDANHLSSAHRHSMIPTKIHNHRPQTTPITDFIA